MTWKTLLNYRDACTSDWLCWGRVENCITGGFQMSAYLMNHNIVRTISTNHFSYVVCGVTVILACSRRFGSLIC